MRKMEFTFDGICLLKEFVRSYKQKIEGNKIIQPMSSSKSNCGVWAIYWQS